MGQYIDEFVHNSKKMSAVGIVSLILVALMLINSIDRTLMVFGKTLVIARFLRHLLFIGSF